VPKTAEPSNCDNKKNCKLANGCIPFDRDPVGPDFAKFSPWSIFLSSNEPTMSTCYGLSHCVPEAKYAQMMPAEELRWGPEKNFQIF
jgi:hypothetical protein